MKRKLPLISILSVLLSVSHAEESDLIQLNGLVNLSGFKAAMFKLNSGAENYLLTEGQSRDGLRLISVDIQKGGATFDNHGTSQKISICSTPAIVSAPDQLLTGKNNDLRRHQFGGVYPSDTSANVTSQPVDTGGFYLPGARVGGNSDTAETPSDVPAVSSNDASSVGSGVELEHGLAKNSWRYAASQSIEAARIRDAAAVRAGDVQPYPLTPLTPRDIAADLVSSQQLYFPPSRQF